MELLMISSAFAQSAAGGAGGFSLQGLLPFILIFITLTNHGRLILNGNWNISENLPLQLCSISNLIACTILFIPKFSNNPKKIIKWKKI